MKETKTNKFLRKNKSLVGIVTILMLVGIVYATTIITDTRIITPEVFDKTDIRFYGAIADDNIDDWSAIQTAINTTYLNGWGELNFPSGQWETSKTLRFYESINYKGTLQGNDKNGTVIKLMDNSNTTIIDMAPFTEGAAPTFVSMQDFMIDGNENNQNEEHVGFLIRGHIKDVFIRRVYVGEVNGSCWELRANKMYLTEVYAEQCSKYGFFLNGSDSTSWGKDIIVDTIYSFGNKDTDLFINGTKIEWVQINHGKLGRGINASALEISGGNENATLMFSDMIFATGSGSSPANQQDIIKLNAGAKNVIFNNIEISGDNSGSGLTPRYGINVDVSVTSGNYSFNNLIFTGKFGTGKTNAGVEYTEKSNSNIVYHNMGLNLTSNNITMHSPDGTEYTCGVANGGALSCS